MATAKKHAPSPAKTPAPSRAREREHPVESMTSFGHAERETKGFLISAEIKTVNHKYFNCKMNAPDVLSRCESALEARVRESLSRGSIQVSLTFRALAGKARAQINRKVAKAYLAELRSLCSELGLKESPTLSHVTNLPGVWEDTQSVAGESDLLPLVLPVVEEALQQAKNMRVHEGRALARHLTAILDEMCDKVAKIDERRKSAVDEYRAKLLQRVQALVKESGVTVGESDLIREISIFADKSDIAEEIARLRAHVDHVRETLSAKGPKGRRLDFLSQEMLREANTISSKANDISISQASVDLKSLIEQVKEQIQNIE